MVDLKINLPEGFLDEEVRCGYTVTRDMKEVWAVELDLLMEFDRVCKKYDIKYFADGGTILGAVRHKGFIPWDDDIDLAMDRTNYEKLCKHALDFSYPYFFQTEDTDPGSYRGHAQLRRSDTTAILLSEQNLKLSFNQGIFIDIFPFDKIPENKTEQQLFFNEIYGLKNQYVREVWFLRGKKSKKTVKSVMKSVIKSVVGFFFKLFATIFQITKKHFNEYEKRKSKYKEINSNIGCNIQMNDLNEIKIIDISYFNKEPLYMEFEFLKLPIPYNYDEYLTVAYGDYMAFKIGANCHGGVVFDTNKSYKEYIKH